VRLSFPVAGREGVWGSEVYVTLFMTSALGGVRSQLHAPVNLPIESAPGTNLTEAERIPNVAWALGMENKDCLSPE
jgi:hypothetical protein